MRRAIKVTYEMTRDTPRKCYNVTYREARPFAVLSVTVQFIGSKALRALWVKLVAYNKQELFDSIQKQFDLFNNFVNDRS